MIGFLAAFWTAVVRARARDVVIPLCVVLGGIYIGDVAPGRTSPQDQILEWLGTILVVGGGVGLLVVMIKRLWP